MDSQAHTVRLPRLVHVCAVCQKFPRRHTMRLPRLVHVLRRSFWNLQQMPVEVSRTPRFRNSHDNIHAVVLDHRAECRLTAIWF